MHSDDLTEANGFWTGARCVLRNTASSIDTLRVTGFNNGTLTFSAQPVNGNMGVDDWGFYMEKRLDLLNAPNEWFYESSSGMLYLQAPGNADPNGLHLLSRASLSQRVEPGLPASAERRCAYR
jgi:hypothetical protein